MCPHKDKQDYFILLCNNTTKCMSSMGPNPIVTEKPSNTFQNIYICIHCDAILNAILSKDKNKLRDLISLLFPY